MERDDLESYWEDIKPKSLVEVVRTRGSDITGMMVRACEETIFDLTRTTLKQWTDQTVTAEMVATMVTTGVRMFVEKWRGILADQNLTGLIEIVLERQNLSAEEIRGFLHALPPSILERIAKSALGSATGTHALVSLEVLRRRRSLTDYKVGTLNHRVWAEFAHPKTQEIVRFFLDEPFTLPGE